MKRMQPSSIEIAAGSGQIATGAIIFTQLLLGCVLTGFGFGLGRYYLAGIGAVVILLAARLFLKTGLMMPGTVLFAASPNDLFIDAAVGPRTELAGYASLHEAFLLEGRPDYLVLAPRDASGWIASLPAERQKEAQDWTARTGSPIAVDLDRLGRISGAHFDKGSLCALVEDNILYTRMAGLKNSARLSSERKLENGLTLITTGDEARVSSSGVCIRLRNTEGVWLFPFSDILGVASTSSGEGDEREILLLLVYQGVLLLLSDLDEAFTAVYDTVSAFDGFDQQTFIRSVSEGGEQPVFCWKRQHKRPQNGR